MESFNPSRRLLASGYKNNSSAAIRVNQYDIPHFEREPLEPISVSSSHHTRPTRPIVINHFRQLWLNPAIDIIFLLYTVTLFQSNSVKCSCRPTCLKLLKLPKLLRPIRLRHQPLLTQEDRGARAMILCGSGQDALWAPILWLFCNLLLDLPVSHLSKAFQSCSSNSPCRLPFTVRILAIPRLQIMPSQSLIKTQWLARTDGVIEDAMRDAIGWHAD